MSEQIREQVSAFLDGELPDSETELLLKRLTRDAELRESFGRYALIGEALRGASAGLLSRGFASRVNLAIDGEPVTAMAQPPVKIAPRWWRPFAGIALAGGVAAVAIITFQQRAVAPGVALLLPAAIVKVAPGLPVGDIRPVAGSVSTALTARNNEPLFYTVPAAPAVAASNETVSALAPARLTNYVFAHSKYSSGLGRRGVLADLLIEDDLPSAAPATPVQRVAQ